MILRLVALFLLLTSPLAAQGPVSIDYTELREETARRLSEYLQINTSNPPGNELAAARWLNGVLAKEGIQGMILDTAELGPGRANFYARLAGEPGGRGIALVHHMDVVTSLCDQVLVLSYGEAIAQGPAREAISSPAVVEAYLGRRAAQRAGTIA